MDNFDLLDEKARFEAISKLPLLERTRYKGALPDYLSIAEIVEILFPVPRPAPRDGEKRKEWLAIKGAMDAKAGAYREQLIKACEKGDIEYKGDIQGWKHMGKNPHPLAKQGDLPIYIPVPDQCYSDSTEDNTYVCEPYHCTIHKNRFRGYLENQEKQLPEELANWWADDDQDARAQGKDYQVRANDLKKWIEETSKDTVDSYTVAEIRVKLLMRNSGLWTIGFDDFWKSQERKNVYIPPVGRKKR